MRGVHHTPHYNKLDCPNGTAQGSMEWRVLKKFHVQRVQESKNVGLLYFK